METIVRLTSLHIEKIKNVKNGQIVMPGVYRKQLLNKQAEVLGLYGQNGSGKTAVIDTLYYLQKIMVGDSLDEELADYIDVQEEQAEISAGFSVFEESVFYEVGYRLLLQRKDKGAEIARETLSCAVHNLYLLPKNAWMKRQKEAKK